MKKTLLLFFFIATKLLLQAQAYGNYGNEWIDPTKTYYKFELPTGGIYRIVYSALTTIPGITNNSLDPNSLILYHNGQPVPIYVSTTTHFGINDYIEFFAYNNTGDIDSLLYRSAADQINPYHSLFSNTSTYYLTTNTLPNNPRFTVVANNINSPPPQGPEKYYMQQSFGDNFGMYYPGKYYSVGPTETYKAVYDVGEGYADDHYFAQPFGGAAPGVYVGGINAIFRANYANNSNENHSVQIFLNNNFQLYPTTPGQSQQSTGFQLNHVEVGFPASQMSSGNVIFNFIDNGNGISSHKDVVGLISLEYPHTFDFNQATAFDFSLSPDTVNNKYIEITNFKDLNSQPILYDPVNAKIYKSVQPPGSSPIKFNLQFSNQKRALTLRADNITTLNATIQSLTPITFTNFLLPQNQGEYFIITNSALFDDGTGHNYIEDYRKYRDNVDNPVSGKYSQARIVDVDLLYDEFGYGIRKSPLAIRNFIHFLYDHGIPKLKYVFLIGKGREAPDIRSGPNTNGAYEHCLVPTFGYPGSDNLLAASRTSDTGVVAVGRLAANNGGQVRDYLEKMKLYEQQQNDYVCTQDIPSKDWQKQVLHFSGGTTGTEQFLFKYYLQTYQQQIEDSLWGAHVTAHSKNTNNPIDQSESQIIKDQINNGVSWITFFGHSATGAFDFSIDEPENYNNAPKFPIILSNGCFSGFIHDATPGYSERFVLEANKGAIAFMATSSLSVSSALNNFSNQLYKNTCVKDYNQSLGIAMQDALKNLFKDSTIDDYTKEIAYEMTLHGDPGLKPNQYPKPDYAIDASSVYTTPSTVTPGIDSFDVNVVVTNLGKCSVNTNAQPPHVVTKDTIAVSLKRTVFDQNNNAVYYYYTKNMPAPFYKDTITFKMPVNISTLGYGQNLFEPYVDAGFKIDEMAECNNGLTTPFTTYIQNDDILPIYPYEFAIVPGKGVTLKASTINPFAPLRTYHLQIDTSELFAHPLAEKYVTQIGGVVHWPTDTSLYPNLYTKDSTVYYWRVQKDSAGALWHYSSFIYLKGEYPGWNQSHYFQYKKDAYNYVKLDTDRIFKFPSSTNQIHVRTGRADAVGGNVDFETLGWDYNNYNEYRFRMGGCGYAPGGLTFAVIDPISGQPWISHNINPLDNLGDQFHNIHCSNKGDQTGFDFLTDGTMDAEIQNFINAIPNGFYVLMYSVNNSPFTGWSSTLINSLGQIGFVSTQFKNGSITGQLVYFTQKGNSSYSSFNAHTNGYYSILDTSFTFQGSWFQGDFTSPKIGPTHEWHSFHWQKQAYNGQLSDVDTVDIIGVRNDGFEKVLLSTGTPNNLLDPGVFNVLADPTHPQLGLLYPYIKLRLRTLDDSLRTPTQLYYWRVLYKKPPEAAINPAAHLVFTDQVNQGSNLHFEVALENVSEVNMDSILTKYTVRDATLNNYNSYIRYNKLDSFTTMTLVFDKNINGNNYTGTNRLIVEANPDNDQIEQYHFNNFAELNFGSIGDKINPLLDVTFDNQHIMNDDIVSAKPNILIMLKDENKYLALDTSSLIDVYIKYPGAAEPTKMVYDNVIMKFYPANASNLAHDNKALVELKPVFTVDGTYELLIKDHDRSGNNSATTDSRYQGNPATFFDYKTTFEVITKPMITNVLNYPNPFTTSTKFVFTITGSEVPDFMKIQIITIKGTVVKEIFKDELGPLHIGRNITEYAWDGRDQYGDLLANGIYFYHVITRLDDKQMDQMGMSYDKYFKKGFGKMAIIR